jgi:AcrR family transcriptional regulator
LPGTNLRPATRRRARTNLRGEQSREAILDVAERHFGEFGFKGASIATIAEEVGLSDPGLLHHFGSKAGLLEALLRQRFSIDEVKLREGEAMDAGQILGMLLAIAHENTGRRNGVRLLMVLFAESLTSDHPASAYFTNRYSHVRKILADHLAAAQVAGQIRPDLSTAALAALLIAVLDGIQLQWLQNADVDMPGIFETLIKVMERGWA